MHQVIDKATDRETMRREGQILRGSYLDAFARIEMAVQCFIERLELEVPHKAPFAQKLQALSKARDQFRHPTKLRDRIHLISEIASIRADIVHSVLAVASIWDGRQERVLFSFQNAGEIVKAARLISADDMRKSIIQLNQLAHQFSQQQLKAPAPAAPASASD